MGIFETDKYQNKTDEWGTPKSVVRPLADAVGGFDLDPASGAESAPHATDVYTKDDDGLHQPWYGNVWCNPPYSDKEKWLKKALDERGNCDTILMLLPVDTSTQWFHKFVTEAAAITFVEGRISFGTGSGSPNFCQMFVVFGEITDALLSALSSQGVVFRSPWRETKQLKLK